MVPSSKVLWKLLANYGSAECSITTSFPQIKICMPFQSPLHTARNLFQSFISSYLSVVQTPKFPEKYRARDLSDYSHTWLESLSSISAVMLFNTFQCSQIITVRSCKIPPHTIIKPCAVFLCLLSLQTHETGLPWNVFHCLTDTWSNMPPPAQPFLCFNTGLRLVWLPAIAITCEYYK